LKLKTNFLDISSETLNCFKDTRVSFKSTQEGNSCNFLDLDIPLTLHDLTKFSDEQFKSSSAYRQESNTPSDQVKPSYPEETTCTQNEDSSMGSSQEVEDWTPEERQQDYNPKTSKEKEEDDSSPFHEEKSNKDLKPESGIGVES
jgi:hypothetical protein